MIGKRIAWLLILLSLAVMYLFDNGTVTLVLLVSCIAAPLLSLAVIMTSGRHVGVALEKADGNVSPAEVGITIFNKDIMPVSDIETDIRCTNLRTGENENVTVTRSIRPKGKSKETLIITPGHAGRYEVSADTIRLYDPLRLWTREIEISEKAYLTSLPDIFNLDMSLTSSSSAMPEGDRYTDSRLGNDPGEVRSIREYVPGDPVRNIHWKLSGKVDKLLVKELGQPVTDNFLIVLGSSADVSFNPEALDAIASVYTSILHTLFAEGIGFTAGWTDPETGEPVFRTIKNEQELIAAADEFLAVPSAGCCAFESIDRSTADNRFAHVIVVGSQVPSGIKEISNGCQVTLIMYGAQTDGMIEAGAEVIGFDEKSFSSELAGVEV